MNSGSTYTCSPKSVLTKGTEAHQRKVASARLIVYTGKLIRAGLDFQDRVTILPVLGLPLDMVRARVESWSGADGAKSFTRQNLSVPNQFFWYAYFFHPSRAKYFLLCNGTYLFSYLFLCSSHYVFYRLFKTDQPQALKYCTKIFSASNSWASFTLQDAVLRKKQIQWCKMD